MKDLEALAGGQSTEAFALSMGQMGTTGLVQCCHQRLSSVFDLLLIFL